MICIVQLEDGTRIPINGPLKIEVFKKGDTTQQGAPLATWKLDIKAEVAGGVSAQSSRDRCEITQPFRDSNVAVNIRLAPGK